MLSSKERGHRPSLLRRAHEKSFTYRLISIEPVSLDDAFRSTRLFLIASIGVILLFVSFSALSRFVSEAQGIHIRSLCPLLYGTGIPCPLCGLTRSLTSLLKGNYLGAFWYHPLGPVVWGGATVFAGGSLSLLCFQRKISLQMSRRARSKLATLLILILWGSNILWGHH